MLVGNDSGGALCQVVAVDHPERLGALVLTNCDMYENFPPSFFKALVAAAKLPGGLKAALQPMRTAAVRRSPLGYGLLSHGDVDQLASGWVRPVFENPDVLEDLRRFTVAIDNEVTLDAARAPARLRQARPVRLGARRPAVPARARAAARRGAARTRAWRRSSGLARVLDDRPARPARRS